MSEHLGQSGAFCAQLREGAAHLSHGAFQTADLDLHQHLMNGGSDLFRSLSDGVGPTQHAGSVSETSTLRKSEKFDSQ